MSQYINTQISYSYSLDGSMMLPKESDGFNDPRVQSTCSSNEKYYTYLALERHKNHMLNKINSLLKQGNIRK